jgi:hypothetical protein
MGLGGGPNGDLQMSQTPKIAGFLETSEADLTPSIALGVTPAKRLNSRLSKSGYETGTPRHRPIKGPLSHSESWVYVTADTDDCDERGQRLYSLGRCSGHLKSSAVHPPIRKVRGTRAVRCGVCRASLGRDGRMRPSPREQNHTHNQNQRRRARAPALHELPYHE